MVPLVSVLINPCQLTEGVRDAPAHFAGLICDCDSGPTSLQDVASAYLEL